LENIQTYDSRDLIESAYDGPLGRAIAQAVRRGKLNLGTT
jgi:hypothetical protein